MVMLDEISRIGFGGYRITSDSDEHYRSLCLALQCGCNLIDTSTNYMDGKSEELIGKVVKNSPDYPAFIITKAGYIQGNNLQRFTSQNHLDLTSDDFVTIDDDFKYCIHPVYLLDQVDNSLERLGISQLDSFLLHNPEHLLKNPEVSIYSKISDAFQFLETMVEQGKIRYYGISSNSFTCNAKDENAVLLQAVVSAAQKLGSGHHFRMIQFPFNFLEQNALAAGNDYPSVLAFAKANNIKTISNRPLNANAPGGSIRLAAYTSDIGCEASDAPALLEKCLLLIRDQLNCRYENVDWMEIGILKFLSANWDRFDNKELASNFFDQSFHSFLRKIYEDDIPGAHLKVYSEFRLLVLNYTLRNAGQKAIAFRKELVQQGIIEGCDHDPLPLVACKYYLNAGIDHVLVGMRKAEYVAELRSIFR